MMRLHLTRNITVRSELFGNALLYEAAQSVRTVIEHLESEKIEKDAPLAVTFTLRRENVGHATVSLHANTQLAREILRSCLPTPKRSGWLVFSDRHIVPLGKKTTFEFVPHTLSSYRRLRAILEARLREEPPAPYGSLFDFDVRASFVSVGAGVSIAAGIEYVRDAFDVWGDGPLRGLGFEAYRDPNTRIHSALLFGGAALLGLMGFMFGGGR